jgi:hypothetical protein
MSGPERSAGGLGAIAATLKSLTHTSLWRAGKALLQLNRATGFSCPGCAWPEAADRARIDFCENGVKHVAHEVTKRRVTREFFAARPIPKLLAETDHWLERQAPRSIASRSTTWCGRAAFRARRCARPPRSISAPSA